MFLSIIDKLYERGVKIFKKDFRRLSTMQGPPKKVIDNDPEHLKNGSLRF